MKEKNMNSPCCDKKIHENLNECPYCGERPISESDKGAHPGHKPGETASRSDKKEDASAGASKLKKFLCRYWIWITVALAIPIGRKIYSTHQITKPTEWSIPSVKYDSLAADSLGSKLYGTSDYHHEKSNVETSDK